MKIKLPKRFYTLEQLAERWECAVYDIEHLIDTRDIKPVWRRAALQGRDHLRFFLTSSKIAYDRACEEQILSNNNRFDVIDFIGPRDIDGAPICEIDSESFVDLQLHAGPGPINENYNPIIIQYIKPFQQDGSMDIVITAAEVSRFEREHGEPTDETAPLPSWPWGDYETRLLQILAEAVNQFCLDGPESYPKKDCGEVVDWIMARVEANGMEASKSLAGTIETLIAPRPYVHHRQRKQKKP